jgi:hypothetical protein
MGVGHEEIFRFFFGEDVGFADAESHCLDRLVAQCPPQAGFFVIDDLDPHCFTKRCEENNAWTDVEGYDGGAVTTFTGLAEQYQCAGSWLLNLESRGLYRLEVHIPRGLYLSESAPYTIRHDGQEKTMPMDLSADSGWLELDVFEFAAGGDQWVQLTDNTGEPYEFDGKRVVFDALRVTSVEQ